MLERVIEFKSFSVRILSMLKRGDVFRREGDPDLLVTISEIRPNGNVSLLYRDKKFNHITYAGTNIKDCKEIKIKGNINKYLPEKINTSKLNINTIMTIAETYDRNL